MTFPARLERFRAVDSTQRVVREWLAEGAPEVAVAVAEYQTAGRGRHGREWVAPPRTALLLSVGFRPAELAIGHAWRLAAVVALSMRDAAEATAGLPDGSLSLKWPNDLVTDGPQGVLLKVGGVLGESSTRGERVESAVVGIGINSDWHSADFPWALGPTMTSLKEMAGRRPIDNEELLDAFLARLDARYEGLGKGQFDVAGWSTAQITTGRHATVELADDTIEGTAVGVDPEAGSLLLQTHTAGVRSIDSGEVIRCRVP